MHLKVVRNKTQSKHSTLGVLFIELSKFCFTLEPPKDPDPNGNGFVCVPAKTYRLRIRWSNHFNKLVPHVEDVPGRSEIEIHIGNLPRDSHGCVLVGFTQPQADYVGQSKDAFTALMDKLYSNAILTT